VYPKNVDHLVELVEKEIKSLREKGPVAENIEKFKAESERQHEVQYATNEAWLGYIYAQLENREPLSLILSFKEQLDKVNQASVQEAAKNI
jgi:zinc protease